MSCPKINVRRVILVACMRPFNLVRTAPDHKLFILFHFSLTKEIHKGIRVGVANRRPRWSGRGHRLAAMTTNRPGSFELESQVHSRLGPPIGDLDTSTEVVGAHRGCQRPRWRGRGSRLGAPIPIPFRFLLLN
ncbi:hypothetical protein CRG98_030149 [Punica granatum]|uniref:Uncharacterized protein n=1 Tax=Punica granatum TaxID=22663 RepID=A0A2I0IZM4_PUNGR|nr:hypothetical protein CRG98_030149 [Punica granatum]